MHHGLSLGAEGSLRPQLLQAWWDGDAEKGQAHSLEIRKDWVSCSRDGVGRRRQGPEWHGEWAGRGRAVWVWAVGAVYASIPVVLALGYSAHARRRTKLRAMWTGSKVGLGCLWGSSEHGSGGSEHFGRCHEDAALWPQGGTFPQCPGHSHDNVPGNRENNSPLTRS